MEAKAIARHVRLTPSKARKVIDLIRGKSIKEALDILKFQPQRSAKTIYKVVHSAAANAEHNLNLSRDALVVAKCFVDEGPRWKRFHPRQRGQAFPILKRTSHVTVVVSEKEG